MRISGMQVFLWKQHTLVRCDDATFEDFGDGSGGRRHERR